MSEGEENFGGDSRCERDASGCGGVEQENGMLGENILWRAQYK
jgi:hypothetical protein